MTQGILVVDVDSSGATITIDPAEYIIPQIVWLKPLGGSPITMTGNWSISFTTDPDMGNETTFVWFAGDFDIATNTTTFEIQSQTITQTMLDSNGAFSIRTVDTSGLNQFIYTPDINTAQAIDGTAIKIDTLPLNRLTGMTSAQVILADGSDVPTATTISGDVTVSNTGVVTIANEAVTNAKLADLTSAYFKVGNGSNRPADVLMSGDATMDNTGAVTIANGAITPAKLSFTTGILSVAQLTLSSAEILALNSTPLQIIASPGVGSSIVVISAVLDYTYGSAAYATNVTLQVYTDTATAPQAAAACLDATATRKVRLSLSTGSIGASDTMVIDNKALYVNVATGDPTAGDGTAVLTIYYCIL